MVWNIKSFPGGKEYLMRAHLSLPSVEGDLVEAKPPIQVKFEIPYFTTSGIQVRDSYSRPFFSSSVATFLPVGRCAI